MLVSSNAGSPPLYVIVMHHSLTYHLLRSISHVISHGMTCHLRSAIPTLIDISSSLLSTGAPLLHPIFPILLLILPCRAGRFFPRHTWHPRATVVSFTSIGCLSLVGRILPLRLTVLCSHSMMTHVHSSQLVRTIRSKRDSEKRIGSQRRSE